MYGTYWFEQLDQHLVDRVGAGNIMFETDYPHPTCLLRDDIVHAANEGLAKIDPDDRQKILWRNAAELYGPMPAADVSPPTTAARASTRRRYGASGTRSQ